MLLSINKHKAGFTLIELMIYVGIVSIVITSLVSFAWNVILNGTKNNTQQEVYSQARYLSERLKYEIRNANDINSVSLSQISLAQNNPNNPTIIALSEGKVTIQQGTQAPVALNSTNTTVTDLTFTNYSSSDNKTKHIGFSLTVVSQGSPITQQYTDTISLQTSAEVRNN